ncbi:MAG: response regulator transcription factor [Armatimonadota bacterium]
MPTVLVADDERLIVNLLRHSLQDEEYDVLTAGDGLSALRLARQHRPDLVILDIAMPGASGLDVCRQLRDDAILRDVLILFLTSRNAVADRVEGLEIGADDYLPKPFDTEELLARVRALLRRSTSDRTDDAPDSHVLRAGALELHPARCAVRVRDEEIELTPVQFDLLYHLMSHPNKVFPAERLLVEVWGYAPGTGDTSLVRWHVKNLRQRIEENPSHPKSLCTVPRQGYVLRSPED